MITNAQSLSFTVSAFSEKPKAKTLVLFAESKKDKPVLTAPAQTLDKAADHAYGKHVCCGRFTGAKGSTHSLHGAGDADQVVFVGLGSSEKLKQGDWSHIGMMLGLKLNTLGSTEVTVALDNLATTEETRAFAVGLHMGAYRMDHFKTDLKAAQKACLKKVTLAVSTEVAKRLKNQLKWVDAIRNGQDTARDTVNLPPNIANPAYMATEAKKLKKLGVKVDVKEQKELEKLGFGLMLAVSQGSNAKDAPKFIMMTYNGGKKKDAPVALVGKGVMFDTGGYQVKPGKPMVGMKADMGGSAVVLGTMRAIAEAKLPINVVGVIGCVKNMIDADAYLPDDIHTGYNGKTVEIGHTDAEGRLVLADCLAYTEEVLKPAEMINFATLTGACLVALGGKYAGVMTHDETLNKKLNEAGEAVDELTWRLPLGSDYQAKSQIADISNDGNPYGGASTAGQFLSNFVNHDKTPWAHMDIAGVAMAEKIPGNAPVVGATGFGVRLMFEYLERKSAA